MDRAARKLTIQTLKGRVALLKIVCDSYSKEFNEETLNQEQKSLINLRWDIALKEMHSLQLMLESLELDEREQTPENWDA